MAGPMHIYGVHPVEELLQAAGGSVETVYYDNQAADRLQTVFERAGTHGIACHNVDHQKLDGMAEGGNHQGVVARTIGFEYAALQGIIDACDGADNAGVLVLDGVQDPHNLGAVLRTAAAVGFDGVVIPKDRAAPVTPTVVRTSAGCAFRIPIARVTNIARTLETLKEARWWTVGTRMQDDPAPWDVDLDMKAAIVMGGEHRGMRRLVEETCDLYTSIPLAHGIDSLNVSAAASILAYEAKRQWETGG